MTTPIGRSAGAAGADGLDSACGAGEEGIEGKVLSICSAGLIGATGRETFGATEANFFRAGFAAVFFFTAGLRAAVFAVVFFLTILAFAVVHAAVFLAVVILAMVIFFD